MLERFSISISATTIIAILAKLAFLYHTDLEHGRDWFVVADQTVVMHFLLAIFLIFLRGKMMHDDAEFFVVLTGSQSKTIYKAGGGWRFLITLGVTLGYVSWLLWAPAIYFLENRARFVGFFFASLVISSIWLVIDIITRIKGYERRALWLLPNLCYLGLPWLLLFPQWALVSCILLLIVLLIDWIGTDPFHGHI